MDEASEFPIGGPQGLQDWRDWCERLPLELAVDVGPDGSMSPETAALVQEVRPLVKSGLQELVERGLLAHLMPARARIQDRATGDALWLGAINVMSAAMSELALGWWAASVAAAPEPFGLLCQQWGLDPADLDVSVLTDAQIAGVRQHGLALLEVVTARPEHDLETFELLAALAELLRLEAEVRASTGG